MLTKLLREGISFNNKDVLDILMEFSSFKDRVSKKFKELSQELEGKSNEHSLWVNLYMISTDYAEEAMRRDQRQEQLNENQQKVS